MTRAGPPILRTPEEVANRKEVARRLREGVRASTDRHWKARLEQEARGFDFNPAQPMSERAARLLAASGAVRDR